MQTVSPNTYVALPIERDVLFGSCAETPGARMRRMGISKIMNRMIVITSVLSLVFIFGLHSSSLPRNNRLIDDI